MWGRGSGRGQGAEGQGGGEMMGEGWREEGRVGKCSRREVRVPNPVLQIHCLVSVS